MQSVQKSECPSQGGGSGRGNESGITVARLLAAVVIACIMAAISVPVFMGVQRAAWDTVAQLDAKHAQNSITTYITASGGDMPPSFTKSAKPYKRTYVLRDFEHPNAIADTSDVEVSLSPDVSVCYTLANSKLDKNGMPTRPSTVGGSTTMGSDGTTTVQNYRLYTTNKNSLDTFYVYDSRTGEVSREPNPDRIPAASRDTEGSVVFRGNSVQYVSNYCDIELHYHLYGS